MKNYFLFILILMSVFSFSQTKKTLKMLEEIEGNWGLDQNNELYFYIDLEFPGMKKDEIYNKVLDFLVFEGIDDFEIKSWDRKNAILEGQGYFPDVHSTITAFLHWISVDAWYYLNIQALDGVARVCIIIQGYEVIEKKIFLFEIIEIFFPPDEEEDSDDSIYSNQFIFITDSYPVNPKGKKKTRMGKVFYRTYYSAHNLLMDIYDIFNEERNTNFK